MNTEFIFELMQKDKSGKIRFPLLSLLFIIFTSLPQHLQSQNQDIFTSTGTWVVPNCVTTITVEVWGGGGGGATGGATNGSGGGGGGGYSASTFTVSSGTTYSVTVGAGGNANSAGGNSWFTSSTTILVLANGGKGASGTTGGAGGAIGTGTIKPAGGNGGNATGTLASPGAAGGNAAGPGGGTGGAAGNTGNGPGGGGGGGGILGGAGGNGAAGQVTISYNINPSVSITNNLPIPAICPGQSVTLTAGQAATYSWAPGTAATTASVSVSPSATTTYTVTGNSPGCTGTAMVTVTVYLPTITVNSVTMCQGDVPTLTASPAVSYIWAPGGETTASINVSPNTTTTYTVTGTGCGHTSSAVSNVTVNCPPVACNNAGFEGGNFSGWTGTYCQTGTNANNYPYPFQIKGLNFSAATANLPSNSNTGYTNNHYIMSSGTDPIAGFPVVCPGGGAFSARLGNTELYGRAESMQYKFVVNANNTAFTYNYAVVMNGLIGPNGHGPCEQPYFKIRMWVYTSPIDSSLISCGAYDVDINTAASIGGFTQLPGSSTFYKPWSAVTIPLSSFIGQTVSVQFITRDCCIDCSTTGTTTSATGGCTGITGGGHYAYAYLDASCAPQTIIPTLSCTGNAILTAPTGAATYLWKGPTPAAIVSGGSTNVATVNATGTYTVTMTTFGTAPCTYSLTYNLTVLNGVTVGVNSTTICKGEQAILTATGNASTYLWSTGETTSTIYVSPNSTTSYSIKGTSSSGCSATKTGTVTVNPLPVITVSPATICNGQGGPGTLTAGGASTYTWSTGVTTVTITASPTVTTTYSVTGTSTAGCVGTGTGVINVSPLPVVTVNSVSICPGLTATLTANGADSYSWSTGQTINPITVTTSSVNTYTVTGNKAGCLGTAVATVSINGNITVTVNSPTICSGQSATLTANGALAYSWSTGATTASIILSPTSTNSYTVNGNSSGCLGTATATITVNPLPTVSVTPTSICSGLTATLTAVGAASYSWSTGETSDNISDSPTVTNNYTVTGTSEAGCVNTAVGTINVVYAPVVTVSPNTICVGGTATLTASGASGYSWSTGQTINPITVAPTSTDSYTVSGTGCPNTTTVTVTVNPIPTVTVAPATICAGSYTTLTAGGANSYTWSTGATTASMTDHPVPTTTYTVIGNSLGCLDTATVTIITKTAPTLTVASTTICIGNPSTLTASGAAFYTWSSGQTTATMTASPTVTTTYTITGVQIGISCPGTTTATITVNPLPVPVISSDTICNGQGGPGTLTASGADSYSWSTGETTAGISVSPTVTTTYVVTGNSLGCLNTATGTITVNPIPVVTSSPFTICNGQTATLTANGANTYLWSNNTTIAAMTASPTVTTTYTVIGNSLGCLDTITTTITVNPIPVVTVISDTICNGQGGPGTLTANGANSYKWSTGATTAAMVASPTVTTTYTVIGNSLGCLDTTTAIMKVNPLPVVAIISDTICTGSMATLTASGAVSYIWSDNSTAAAMIASPTVTGTYTVTGNSLGCLGTATGTVTVNPIPLVTVNDSTICKSFSATLKANGAASYVWSTGETTASITKSPASTTGYSVTGTSLGCSQTVSATITVLLAPTVVVTPQSVCIGQTASLFASGAPSYIWNNNTSSTANPLLVNPAVTTTYTVEGTGCPNTTTVTVTVNPMPDITASSTTVCNGTLGTIKAYDNGNNISTYTWSTGANSISITDMPPATTTYTVVGATTFGCKDTAVGTIVVKPNPIIKVTEAHACPKTPATLNASGADYYLWSTGANTPSITAAPGVTTSYSVIGTTTWSCTSTGIGTIIIDPAPKARFIASPNPTGIYDPQISFFNQSSIDVVYWHWDFGNGDTLSPNTTSPIYTYPEQVAKYTVTLIVHNSAPCWDTISSDVFIDPEFAFYIPNSFTPNGDKNNNGFRGTGVGIAVYHLQIFDRWGDLIWESRDLDDYWDGKANGGSQIVQQDTYVWKVFLTDVFGREHHYIGTVTAIK